MARKKVRYTVSDGELVLVLEPAAEGGYVVTAPFNPDVIALFAEDQASERKTASRRKKLKTS
jgi:hypothetical protein